MAAWYEIGIRIHDTAHSEFAGWMSAVLTLPSIIVVNFVASAALGMRMGDSNQAFIWIVGCAALINAAIICAIVSKMRA